MDRWWPVVEWFAEDPARPLYCVAGCAVIGFAAAWSWHNRRGR